MALLHRSSGNSEQPFSRWFRGWWRRDPRSADGEAPTPFEAAPCETMPGGDPHIPGHWDSQSLKAAQMIWGHSLLGPCSADELAAIAAWLKPARSSRIALLGAGLGGLGLALSRTCHCKVIGFEQADILLKLCPDSNHGHLRSLDSITVKTEHSFDHVIVDGLSHRAGDIIALLKPAAALASLRGSVLIRGYCVTSDAVRTGEKHRRWAAAEPVAPQLLTFAELSAEIGRAGFKIIDRNDSADIHVAAVDTCWGTAVDLIRLLNRKPRQRSLIPALVREGDLWRERLQMIHDGELQVVELLAKRPPLR